MGIIVKRVLLCLQFSMRPAAIIILGPTSSGKTVLAQTIAVSVNAPIINSDAIQVYKNLDYLSNKPSIASVHQNESGETITLTSPERVLDTQAYANVEFIVYRVRNKTVVLNQTFSRQEFFLWLERNSLFRNRVIESDVEVENYLFGIQTPGTNYSVANFVSDARKIVRGYGKDPYIMTGGTVFYAYHYTFGTQFTQKVTPDHIASPESPITCTKSNFATCSKEKLIEFLSEHDPEILKIIDIHNKARLLRAVQFLHETGRKFSEQYYKQGQLLDDFLLIVLQPKNRGDFVCKLDEVVADRVTSKEAMGEIENIIAIYGDQIKPWLRGISYEYRYSLEMYEKYWSHGVKLHASLPEVVALQAKERQYTKRQMAFIRKFTRDLQERLL